MQEKMILARRGDEVFGYERKDQVPADMLLLTPEEVAEHLNPSKTLAELASAAQALVNAEYSRRMGAIADAYPLHERESWPVQLQEARDLMLYAGLPVPNNIKTPWIDQCAQQRGMDRMELAARIVAKDEGYRQISGFLSGVRQWHEDCIDLLLEDGEEAREELQVYNHLQGWVPAQAPDSEDEEVPHD